MTDFKGPNSFTVLVTDELSKKMVQNFLPLIKAFDVIGLPCKFKSSNYQIYTSTVVIQLKSGSNSIINSKYLWQMVTFIHMCIQINNGIYLCSSQRTTSVDSYWIMMDILIQKSGEEDSYIYANR